MEVVNFNEYLKKNDNFELSVSIGDFDGVHLGHQALIRKVKELSKIHNSKSAIITFDPHPSMILGKTDEYEYVTPLNEKIRVLESYGLDYLILIDFDETLMKTSPQDFVLNYLLKINVIDVVVGYDFTFGANKLGEACMINQLSSGKIRVEIIDEIKYKSSKVGTTLIKKELKNGNLTDVYYMLGRFYRICGIVGKGRGVGRTIELPTANIITNENYVKVKPGVYGVIVTIFGKRYIGLANYGHNPSFNYKNQLTLEINIIDCNQDLYNQNIIIDFVTYIRNEQVFGSKLEFLEQIEKDKKKIIEIVNKYL